MLCRCSSPVNYINKHWIILCQSLRVSSLRILFEILDLNTNSQIEFRFVWFVVNVLWFSSVQMGCTSSPLLESSSSLHKLDQMRESLTTLSYLVHRNVQRSSETSTDIDNWMWWLFSYSYTIERELFGNDISHRSYLFIEEKVEDEEERSLQVKTEHLLDTDTKDFESKQGVCGVQESNDDNEHISFLFVTLTIKVKRPLGWTFLSLVVWLIQHYTDLSLVSLTKIAKLGWNFLPRLLNEGWLGFHLSLNSWGDL